MPEPEIEPAHTYVCRPCRGSGQVTTNIHNLVCCHCRGNGVSVNWDAVEGELDELLGKHKE